MTLQKSLATYHVSNCTNVTIGFDADTVSTYHVSYCTVGYVRFDANANRAPRGRHVGCRRSAFGQVRLLCGHDSGRNFLLLGFQDAGGVGARLGVEVGCHWRLRLRPNWITRRLSPLAAVAERQRPLGQFRRNSIRSWSQNDVSRDLKRAIRAFDSIAGFRTISNENHGQAMESRPTHLRLE